MGRGMMRTAGVVDLLDQLPGPPSPQYPSLTHTHTENTYHLKIIQGLHPLVLTNTLVARAREGLFHEFRIGFTEDRVEDGRIEVLSRRGWGCWWV